MSICQRTHQDLMGAASARGMRLHFVTFALQLFDRKVWMFRGFINTLLPSV